MTRGWRRLGLRSRLMLIGVLGVAAALAAGSVVLYVVLNVVAFRTLDRSASATAREVAGLVDAGRLPDPIPVPGDEFVQVLDSSGRVVSASADADRLTSLLLPHELASALAGHHLEVSGSRAGRASPLRITAVRAGTAVRPRTVVVGSGFADIESSQRVLGLSLLATYPLLVAVLALISSRVIGAALRPVEELRSAADRISGTGQDVRLPVPETRDEIRELALTLNSMLDRLEAARARQRSFVADAAHELRSPLASMLTQIEVSEHLGETTATSRDLHEEVVRMSGLVESLLTLARLDQRPRAGATTPVLLAPLVRQAVRRRHGGVRIGGNLEGIAVLADADHVRRVLDNLLDNAQRHARSSVEVSAVAHARTMCLVVDDDGTGIAPEDRERVFERFTRLDEARDRDAGGSGLGLAIVRELVQADGGTVALGTAPRGGLRVSVSWPSAR